jgi:acyl carrier protein
MNDWLLILVSCGPEAVKVVDLGWEGWPSCFVSGITGAVSRGALMSSPHNHAQPALQGACSVTIREVVRDKLASVVEAYSPVPFPESIRDEDALDAFGLDSVAFTSLIAQLEEEMGFIPSAILEGDAYPETFGELVAAYQR